MIDTEKIQRSSEEINNIRTQYKELNELFTMMNMKIEKEVTNNEELQYFLEKIYFDEQLEILEIMEENDGGHQLKEIEDCIEQSEFQQCTMLYEKLSKELNIVKNNISESDMKKQFDDLYKTMLNELLKELNIDIKDENTNVIEMIDKLYPSMIYKNQLIVQDGDAKLKKISACQVLHEKLSEERKINIKDKSLSDLKEKFEELYKGLSSDKQLNLAEEHSHLTKIQKCTMLYAKLSKELNIDTFKLKCCTSTFLKYNLLNWFFKAPPTIEHIIHKLNSKYVMEDIIKNFKNEFEDNIKKDIQLDPFAFCVDYSEQLNSK